MNSLKKDIARVFAYQASRELLPLELAMVGGGFPAHSTICQVSTGTGEGPIMGADDCGIHQYL